MALAATGQLTAAAQEALGPAPDYGVTLGPSAFSAPVSDARVGITNVPRLEAFHEAAIRNEARASPNHVAGLALKAPTELFERLDRWCEQQVARPSRPAAIRWIVHQFLLKQGHHMKRPPRGKK